MDVRSGTQTFKARRGRRNGNWARGPGKVNVAHGTMCLGDVRRFNFPLNTADWPFPVSHYHLLPLQSFKIAQDFLKTLE